MPLRLQVCNTHHLSNLCRDGGVGEELLVKSLSWGVGLPRVQKVVFVFVDHGNIIQLLYIVKQPDCANMSFQFLVEMSSLVNFVLVALDLMFVVLLALLPFFGIMIELSCFKRSLFLLQSFDCFPLLMKL